MNTNVIMRHTLLVTCVILGLILTSCGSHIPEVKEPSQPYVFPKSVQLQFKATKLVELAQEQPRETWEHTKSINFGDINEEPVTMEIYKVTEGELCGSSYERVALLEYKKVKYRHRDCFSKNLEGEAHPALLSAMFLLDYKQLDAGSSRFVHGAVEVSANGPGRMVYYVFDPAQSRWYAFEDWGYPKVVDLDSDGTAELVSQFKGLHLRWPDISIYRWNEHGLENNSSIKNTLKLPNEPFSEATLDDQNLINIVAVISLDQELNKETSYQYSNGEIIQINGE